LEPGDGQAINDSGHIVGFGFNPSGQTHAFLLNPSPAISINLSGDSVTLAWPTNFSSGFTLESTMNLVPPVVWNAGSNTPAVVNGQYTVTIPLSGAQRFFWLSQ
jgi:probable HAF family extracellular repeat protein